MFGSATAKSFNPTPKRLAILVRLATLVLVLGGAGALFWAYRRWESLSDQPPVAIEQLTVVLVGDEYELHFCYRNVGGAGGDLLWRRDLVIPEGARTRLLLQSRDYVYTVEIPSVGVYEPAVPGKSFQTEFDAPPVGNYPLLGSQMCGLTHPGLLGKLVVYPQSEFRRFLLELPSCEPANEVDLR